MSEISSKAQRILNKINYEVAKQSAKLLLKPITAKAKEDFKNDTIKSIKKYFTTNYQTDVVVKGDPNDKNKLIVYSTPPKYIEVDITIG